MGSVSQHRPFRSEVNLVWARLDSDNFAFDQNRVVRCDSPIIADHFCEYPTYTNFPDIRVVIGELEKDPAFLGSVATALRIASSTANAP